MKRIKEYVTRWTVGRARAEIAALTAGVIVIAVVPGGLILWIAWRFLRTRKLADLRP